MEEEYVLCPYNQAHKMLRKRLIPHMIKCKKLYPEIELKSCPFNQAHLVKESEFVKHTTTCPDRKLITQYQYRESTKEDDDNDKPQQQEIHCDENWDDEIVEDFNPQKKLKFINILKQPDSLLRSERKVQLKEEEINFEEENELARPKTNGQFNSKQKLRKIKIECKAQEDSLGNYKKQRPLTPPPPTGINWKSNRERSRSPI